MKIFGTQNPGSPHNLNSNKAVPYTAATGDEAVIVHRLDNSDSVVLLTGGINRHAICGIRKLDE